jgi:hypothetical protein
VNTSVTDVLVEQLCYQILVHAIGDLEDEENVSHNIMWENITHFIVIVQENKMSSSCVSMSHENLPLLEEGYTTLYIST